MKKMSILMTIFLMSLFFSNCEHPSFECVIDNKSDYPAQLSLRYSKHPQDTLSLKPREKVTVSFFYPGENIKLISNYYNEIEKLSESKYLIKNSKPVQYKVHNFLPINITLLDNSQYLLVNKDTQKKTESINIPCDVSHCYCFTNIKLQNIIIKAIPETTIGDSTYSLNKIGNYYYLHIKNNAQSIKHRINIDITSNEIIFSY